MAYFVKTRLYIAFQDPFRSGSVAQYYVALIYRICWSAFLPEPIRVRVRLDFCDGIECKQVQSLHCSIFHRRNRKWALTAIAFWYVDTPQWSRTISSLGQRFYGFGFLLRGFPDFSIDPWCPLALVFSHSFDGKGLAAKGVGQQVLQRLHFAPLALLLSLYDTHLKPLHLLIDCLPVHSMPVHLLVGSCTSSYCFCRHLRCLLCRFVK